MSSAIRPSLSAPGGLLLAAEHRRAVERHLVRRAPEECCGVLLGVDGEPRRVVEVVPTVNDHPGDRRRRYRIPVEELLALHRRARAEGLEVIGYYHSHPRGAPEPSATDRADAWPGPSYLIAGPAAAGRPRMRSWRWDAERAEPREERLISP